MKKENLKSKMILQVHDELVFDVEKSELEIMEQQIPAFMKTALELGVPMDVGMDKGNDWLSAH